MSFKLRVSQHHHGRRLDKVIRSLWPELPLGAIMKNIRKGSVRVDGKKASCSTRLSQGQEIYVPWEEPSSEKISTAVEKALDTVYRDDFIWVINKPSNLLSQPSRKGEDSVLSRSWAERSLVSDDFRPTLVNRLDRNTSGLVLLALQGGVLRDLQELLKNGKIRKFYIAVVCGEIARRARLEFPLLKDPDDNTVRVDKAGRPSISNCRRIFSDGRYSLVELELVTGRSHQARVHLAHSGNPILGDRKYGNRKENEYWWNRGVRRPLLHAYSLGLPEMENYPAIHSSGAFRAPLPGDILRFFSTRRWRDLSLE